MKPAIKTKNGQVIEAKGKKDHHKDIGVKGERGFEDKGHFIDRKEAAKRAKKAGFSDVKELHSHNLPGRKGKK